MAQFRKVVVVSEVITKTSELCHPQCYAFRLSFDTASCQMFARANGGCALLERQGDSWFRCTSCLRAESQFEVILKGGKDEKEDEKASEDVEDDKSVSTP